MIIDQLKQEGIVVMDDALPSFMFKHLTDVVLADTFPWKRGTTVHSNDSQISFGHPVDLSADDRIAELTYTAFLSILESAGIQGNAELIRARFNCLVRDVTPVLGFPHIDQAHNHLVALLYLNDSDGDTVMYSVGLKELKQWKTITPKANRLVVFDGSIYHSSTTPTNNRMRLVANYNFYLS